MLHSLRKTQISMINPSSDEHNGWITRQYSIEKFLKYIYFRRQFLVQARSRALRPFSGIEAFPSTETEIPGKENDEGHNGGQLFFVNCKNKQLFLLWEERKQGGVHHLLVPVHSFAWIANLNPNKHLISAPALVIMQNNAKWPFAWRLR